MIGITNKYLDIENLMPYSGIVYAIRAHIAVINIAKIMKKSSFFGWGIFLLMAVKDKLFSTKYVYDIVFIMPARMVVNVRAKSTKKPAKLTASSIIALLTSPDTIKDLSFAEIFRQKLCICSSVLSFVSTYNYTNSCSKIQENTKEIRG